MLIGDAKKAVRVSSDAANDEILDLIEAAKFDLSYGGVNSEKTITVGAEEVIDPLIKRAIILYCKAHFGYDNPEADRFEASYQSLKNHLALSADYQRTVG